jgi:hypothetical protein
MPLVHTSPVPHHRGVRWEGEKEISMCAVRLVDWKHDLAFVDTPELVEVNALVRAGRIRARVQRSSLDEAAGAYDVTRGGDRHRRAVVVP